MICSSSAPPSHHESFQALLEERHVEVHQQTDAQSRELQISEDLRVVDGRERINRFYLDNYGPLNHQIEPIACVEPLTLVDDRQRELALDCEPSPGNFESETVLVSRLKQPRPSAL